MKQLLHEFYCSVVQKENESSKALSLAFLMHIEAMPFCAVFYLFYHLEQLSWNASFLTLSDAGIVAAISSLE